jgi:aldehyde dehydrogenase (NAD+)
METLDVSEAAVGARTHGSTGADGGADAVAAARASAEVLHQACEAIGLRQTDACFVNGQWRAPASQQRLALLNPSDGSHLAWIAGGAAADVDAAVQAAQAALHGEWGGLKPAERGRLLMRISQAVAARADALAQLEALDVGKPLRQGHADALALARYLEFYAGACDKMHGQTLPLGDGMLALTLREPHGVTGHIVPWNYPMQIIGRSVGAALAMGNACVLKPAEEACLTALAFVQIASDAGLPAGALNLVPGLGEAAGAALSAHGGVAHLSFTGSVATGRLIQAAAARNTIPVTLELGGKSPQIVFDDADLEAALPFLVNAGIQNAGQTCSAASRILVQRGVFDQVARAMTQRYRSLRLAPALDDGDVGPLISRRQADVVQRYLKLAQDDGLPLLAQAPLPAHLPAHGHYVPPTLFGPLAPDHALAQEEIFGPVQVLIPFDDEAQALRIANGTAYGLVAGIWTRDGSRALRLARRLKCGQVFINNYGAGGGVELPFGGVKSSGHGREKGFEALYGFSTLKTIAIAH